MPAGHAKVSPYGYVRKDLQQTLNIFVFGYFLEHVGNLLLIYKIYKKKAIYGVSIQS